MAKKLKLKKQTVFTLLGLLVIVISIPVTILLVKQRQEIRKEAAITNDNACTSIQGTCGTGSCQYGERRANLCAGDINRKCCAPNCGQWCASRGLSGSAPICQCSDKGIDFSEGGKNYHRTQGPVKTWDCSSCTGYRITGTVYVPPADVPPADVPPADNNQSSWSGTAGPLWHLVKTGRTCSVTPPTPTPTKPPTPTPTKPPTPTPTKPPTPTPTTTITPTPTTTITPTPTTTITPTPTITAGCNQSCSTNSNCQDDLICSSGYCRNKDCTTETDCNCPGPTPTPTNTPTPTPTPTTTPGITSTPTPTTTPGLTSTPTPTTTVTELAQVTPTVTLPEAGFVLPTFGIIIAGFLLVIVSLAFLL